MVLNKNFREFIELLNDHEVRYLVVYIRLHLLSSRFDLIKNFIKKHDMPIAPIRKKQDIFSDINNSNKTAKTIKNNRKIIADFVPFICFSISAINVRQEVRYLKRLLCGSEFIFVEKSNIIRGYKFQPNTEIEQESHFMQGSNC